MSYTLVPSELIVDGAITSAKLDTNISISGTLGVTGELTLATHLNMGDNDKIKIGTGGDLEIYHDGSNSYIANSTGNIYIADTNGAVHIQAKLNEESIVASADGAVTLYHDNSAKLATASGGVNITGGLSIGGTEVINSSRNALNLTNLVVDNIDLGGSAITVSSGDFTIDVAGNIILNADSDSIKLADGSTEFGKFYGASNNFYINAVQQDKDIIFVGDDGGSSVTALTLDMSAAGKATFNSDIVFGSVGPITSAGNVLKAVNTGENGFLIRSAVSSAANPSYSSVDDTNTGMFLPSSDVIGLTTGGTERWRIDSSGHFTGVSGSKIVQTIASGGGNFLEVRWKNWNCRNFAI
jgi:hypothetical protein